MKNISYISDCQDDNARGRIQIKLKKLFPNSQITFIGAKNEFEAGFNIIDSIDAGSDFIFANVAPRYGNAKKWENGTPFGRLKYNNIDIFTTIDGYTLSLLQKISQKKLEVEVYDIPKVVPFFDISDDEKEKIIHTQFRSLNYLPLLGYELYHKHKLPFEIFDEIPDQPHGICWIDCFGNAKTSILPEELDLKIGQEKILQINNQKIIVKHLPRLKDLPDNEVGLIVGSSGLNEKRFLEIMIQGGSAEKKLKLKTGDLISF